MNKKIALLCLSLIWLAFFSLLLPNSARAIQNYDTGSVLEIIEESQVETDGTTFYIQQVKVQNDRTGEISQVQVGSEFQPLNQLQRLDKGVRILLTDQLITPEETEVVIADLYRLPLLAWLAVGFFLIVLVVSGWKGFFSILGMFASLIILLTYIVPSVLAGGNPFVISLVGCLMIALVTIYLSHGISTKSHLALLSIVTTLLIVAILSWWYVQALRLVGLGSEDAYFLQFGSMAAINLRGLLLGGILLGALGVLDDITVSQVSLVFELNRANPKYNFHQLYQSAMRVGRDHVASLVNTLVLAYAGANLPLFLLFAMSDQAPAWVNLNTELLAEEIVRTLLGSIGLVLAVPITTLLATYFAVKKRPAAKLHP